MTSPTTSARLRFIRRVLEPARGEHVALVGATLGALALVDPARSGVVGRLALRVAMATVAGFEVWTVGRASDPHNLLRPIRWGATAASVGMVLAAAEAGEALDGRLQRRLRRAGVRRPRLAIALLSVGLTIALSRVGVTRDHHVSDTDDNGDAPESTTVAVPGEVDTLVAAILSATDSFGAPALRAQLQQARAVEYLGADEAAFYPGIGFEVPPGLPRAVPGEARFPVIGRYHPFGGKSADVYVSVVDGRLANLTVAPGSDWSPEDVGAWMDSGGSAQEITGWPHPDELAFLMETDKGLEPA